MAITAEELERILKIAALVQQGALELANFLQNKSLQKESTTEQILDHAEARNEEARKLIESL